MTPPPTPPKGRYLVTGAAGFIGRHALPRLLDAGCEVLALDVPGALSRPDPEGAPLLPKSPALQWAHADLADEKTLASALEGERFDYALHLAAKVGDWGPAEAFERANVRGARLVLESAWKSGARAIVHVSSIAAMGFAPGHGAGPELLPATETEDPYSRTKAEGENAARKLQGAGAPIVIVRPGDVYGPGSEPWVNRPLRMMRSRQMILVDGGRGHFAHVWVESLVDGFFLALANEDAIGRTYVLTDAEQDTTMGDYFRRLAEAAGAPKPLLSVPKPAALLLATGLERAASTLGFAPPITRTAVEFVTKDCSYSIEAARRELGWSPRLTLSEGLARIAATYRGARP